SIVLFAISGRLTKPEVAPAAALDLKSELFITMCAKDGSKALFSTVLPEARDGKRQKQKQNPIAATKAQPFSICVEISFATAIIMGDLID
ncbi:MAG: hypothetical protein K2X27_28655, partial [Candidatus Obscuribacterales bacterium]|nr:hypothetical protein [Candidatus Obscuribacterales bacterium]